MSKNLQSFEPLEGRCLLSADLTVSIVSPPPGGVLSGNAETTALVTIRNAGPSDVRDRFGVNLFVSTDATFDSNDTLVGSKRRSGSEGGESETKDIKFRLPNSLAPGEYTLFAQVDSDGVIAESDETNNVSAGVAVTVGAGGGGGGGGGNADLVITITAPVGGSTLTLGREHLVVVSARNQGGATVPARAGINLYASTDALLNTSNDTLLVSRSLSSMSAGETEIEDLKFTLPAGLGAGNFFLIAVIDPAAAVNESVETNNISTPVGVTFTGSSAAGSRPDLSVSVSLGDGDDSLSRSGEGEVFVTVFNSGATATGGRVGVSVYASSDSTFDPAADLLLGSRLLSSLKAGETKTNDVDFVVPAGLAEGEYTIYAVVDGAGVITESDESNNTSGGVVATVHTARLDLAGSLTRVTLDDSIVAGTRTRGLVKLDFSNIGDDLFVRGQKADIRAYLRPDGAVNASTDIAISRDKQQSLSRLSNDRPKNVALPVEVPTTIAAGNYRLVVKLDSNNEVAESNELNNEIFAPGNFVISAPFVDLAISGSFSQRSSSSGTTIRGTYALNNFGNVSARGTTAVEFLLVNGDGVQTVLTPVVSKRISIASGRSSSQVRTSYVVPSGLAAGSYNLLVRLTGVEGFTDTRTINNSANIGNITVA